METLYMETIRAAVEALRESYDRDGGQWPASAKDARDAVECARELLAMAVPRVLEPED